MKLRTELEPVVALVRMTDAQARRFAQQDDLFNRIASLCGNTPPRLAEAVERGFGPHLYELAAAGRLTADAVRRCADGGR